MRDTPTEALPPGVPESYAEKAMASLMQLHSELMAEKERRLDLYRRLMEREQALAELRMYVRVLEDRLGQAEGYAVTAEAPSQEPELPARTQAPTPPPPPNPSPSRSRGVTVLRVAPPPADGWKT